MAARLRVVEAGVIRIEFPDSSKMLTPQEPSLLVFRGSVTHFPPRCHIQIVSAWSGRSDAELLVLEDPDAFAELYDRHVNQIPRGRV